MQRRSSRQERDRAADSWPQWRSLKQPQGTFLQLLRSPFRKPHCNEPGDRMSSIAGISVSLGRVPMCLKCCRVTVGLPLWKSESSGFNIQGYLAVLAQRSQLENKHCPALPIKRVKSDTHVNSEHAEPQISVLK